MQINVKKTEVMNTASAAGGSEDGQRSHAEPLTPQNNQQQRRSWQLRYAVQAGAWQGCEDGRREKSLKDTFFKVFY